MEGIHLFDKSYLEKFKNMKNILQELELQRVDDSIQTIVDELQISASIDQDELKLNQLKTEMTEGASFSEIYNPIQPWHKLDEIIFVSLHLRKELERLIKTLFSDPDLKIRWIKGSFPFTCPSWEMEIWYNNQWLEILGCGVIQQQILKQNKNSEKIGWAFGLGLERIAMILFDIPDIRLFWSTDKRFLDQFAPGKSTRFTPFSKYPMCYKDVSFWIASGFHDNDFYELVRDECGDLAESIKLIDTFKKNGETSKCYRINFRSMERTLENKELDGMEKRIRERVAGELGGTLRG